MTSRINYVLDNDNNCVKLSHILSSINETHLLPIDGKYYHPSIFGLHENYFKSSDVEVFGTFMLHEFEEGVTVWMSDKGKISAKRGKPVVEGDFEISTDGIISSNLIDKSMITPVKLAKLLNTIQHYPIKVKYDSLVNLLIEHKMTKHIPYLIRTSFKNINFKAEPKVNKNNTLEFGCDNSLNVTNFKFEEVDGDVKLNISVGNEVHSVRLVTDGGVCHLSEVGLSLEVVEKFISKDGNVINGYYNLKLSNGSAIIINRLGLIEVKSSGAMFADRYNYHVSRANRLTTQVENCRPTNLVSEAKGMVVYAILSSFNNVSKASLFSTMEYENITNYHKEILEAISFNENQQ